MLAEDVVPKNKHQTNSLRECIRGKLFTIQYLRSGHPQIQLFAPPLAQPSRIDQSSRWEENVKVINRLKCRVSTELRKERFVNELLNMMKGSLEAA